MRANSILLRMSLAPSGFVNAGTKIDNGVHNLDLMAQNINFRRGGGWCYCQKFVASFSTPLTWFSADLILLSSLLVFARNCSTQMTHTGLVDRLCHWRSRTPSPTVLMMSSGGCVPTGSSWTLRRPRCMRSIYYRSTFSSAATVTTSSWLCLRYVSFCRSWRWHIHWLWRLDEVTRHEDRLCLLRCTASAAKRPSVYSQIRSPTRPDHGNATFAGIQPYLLKRLQSMMNSAARLVFFSLRYEHITPLLHQLHWLKAADRID